MEYIKDNKTLAEHANIILGMDFNSTKEYLKSLSNDGLHIAYRVVSFDNIPCVITSDFMMYRMNFKLENNIITDISYG